MPVKGLPVYVCLISEFMTTTLCCSLQIEQIIKDRICEFGAQPPRWLLLDPVQHYYWHYIEYDFLTQVLLTAHTHPGSLCVALLWTGLNPSWQPQWCNRLQRMGDSDACDTKRACRSRSKRVVKWCWFGSSVERFVHVVFVWKSKSWPRSCRMTSVVNLYKKLKSYSTKLSMVAR